MSYHQGDRIKLRAHWLAIEFVFYLLGLLTLGAQLASLLTSLPRLSVPSDSVGGRGGFRPPFLLRAVMAVTAPRDALCLVFR